MAGHIQDSILLLGDSLTQLSAGPGGLSQQLSDVYQRKLDVVNRGFSGYNSRWALPVFQNVFSKKSERANLPTVRLLTIWYGANDAVEPEGAQHVPLDEYASNLTKLIQLVKAPSSEWYSPDTRIILLTPPPVNTTLWFEFLKQNEVPIDHSDRTVERTRTYAEAVIAVGKKEGVPVVDIFSLLWVAGENEEGLKAFLSDGLHLKAEGYKLVYDALIKSISENYPELHYEKVPLAYPDWKELKTDNFAELLNEPLVKKQQQSSL